MHKTVGKSQLEMCRIYPCDAKRRLGSLQLAVHHTLGWILGEEQE